MTERAEIGRFVDKTALVTGATMGLGAAVARRLASEGARVLCVARGAAGGRETTAGLPGSGHVFLQADLSRPEEIARLAEEVRGVSDAVDVLINNAGISIEAPLEEMRDEDWERQMAINLRAPVLLTRALLPLMRDRGASIVNVSSQVGFHPRRRGTAYDTTKAGLGGLTRSLAAELWQYGVRVNEMAPGGIVTEMHFAGAEDPAARKRELEEWELPEQICIMRRLAQPEEIAPAVAFLASEEASYITASTLRVDGGPGMLEVGGTCP